MTKILLLILSVAFFITSCSPSNKTSFNDPLPVITTEENIEVTENHLDDIIFFGESTTYHLKSRGVLPDGTNTKQVWAPKSGTLMLDASICDCKIIYPESNEETSLKEALLRKKPKKMLLTFGLNGATIFINKGEAYFKYCYQKLINLICEASPNTEIIINSCFPIGKNMDMSRYSINSKELNSYIDTLNIWAKKLANENGLTFTDTAVLLKDSNGYLASSFQADDGYHLNTAAYNEILKFLNNDLQKRNKIK